MASVVAAYNGGLGAEPQRTAVSRSRAPGGVRGRSPPEAESLFKYRMSKIRHKITSFQCFKR